MIPHGFLGHLGEEERMMEDGNRSDWYPLQEFHRSSTTTHEDQNIGSSDVGSSHPTADGETGDDDNPDGAAARVADDNIVAGSGTNQSPGPDNTRDDIHSSPVSAPFSTPGGQFPAPADDGWFFATRGSSCYFQSKSGEEGACPDEEVQAADAAATSSAVSSHSGLEPEPPLGSPTAGYGEPAVQQAHSEENESADSVHDHVSLASMSMYTEPLHEDDENTHDGDQEFLGLGSPTRTIDFPMRLTTRLPPQSAATQTSNFQIVIPDLTEDGFIIENELARSNDHHPTFSSSLNVLPRRSGVFDLDVDFNASRFHSASTFSTDNSLGIGHQALTSSPQIAQTSNLNPFATGEQSTKREEQTSVDTFLGQTAPFTVTAMNSQKRRVRASPPPDWVLANVDFHDASLQRLHLEEMAAHEQECGLPGPSTGSRFGNPFEQGPNDSHGIDFDDWIPELSQDYERLKHIAETAAKLTNKCPQDERLSTNLASSTTKRVAKHKARTRSGLQAAIPYILNEGNNLLEQRHQARLQEALGSETRQTSHKHINFLPLLKKGTHWIMSKFALTTTTAALIKNKHAAAARHRKATSVCVGIVIIVGLLLTLLIFVIAYPASIQKSLNMSEFTLNEIAISNSSSNSFQLTMQLNVLNKNKLSGRLEPMAMDLSTEKRVSTSYVRARTMKSPLKVYTPLQRLNMPSIVFARDQMTRSIKSEQSYIDRTEEWGDFLARIFRREDQISLVMEGTSIFKKGIMKSKAKIEKSISVVQMHLDKVEKQERTGIIDWHLDAGAKLQGKLNFPNPTNLSLFMGDLVFDLLHQNAMIGVLRIPNYHLLPGLNTGVDFAAELNPQVFQADKNLLGSFLSTLMLIDPRWDENTKDKLSFKLIGQSAMIQGTEIPWLTTAVQGIRDPIYMLSNMKNGTIDTSNIVSDVALQGLKFGFSDFYTHDDGSFTTLMLGGRLSLKVQYPMDMQFYMDILHTTHVLDFIHVTEHSQETYARIEVTESNQTSIWASEVDRPNGRLVQQKLLFVNLTGTRLTIFNPEVFTQNLLRPLMNDASVSAIVKGEVRMSVQTPLGQCSLMPIIYEKGIGIRGMAIFERPTTLVVNNVVVQRSYQNNVDRYPKLEMTYDLQVRAFGDSVFEFGDMVFDIMNGNAVIGRTKIDNFTINPGLNIYHGVSEVGPEHPRNEETYFNTPILNHVISGKRMFFRLAGASEGLGVLGPLLNNRHRGFPCEIASPRQEILGSLELTVNKDLKPMTVSLAVMNPLHAAMAVTYFEGNITTTRMGTLDPKLNRPPTEPNRRLATITGQKILRIELPPNTGTLAQKYNLPKLQVSTGYLSNITEEDISNQDLDLVVQAKIGIDIGGYTALVPYVVFGRAGAYTPDKSSGGGTFKIVLFGPGSDD